jgi:hypothetical protein
MKPYDLLRPWKAEAAIDRVEGCRILLHIHGFLTDAENQKVAKRVAKWHTKEAAKAKGHIVRYYRHPQVDDQRACEKCGRRMIDHGWIDTLEGGHIVCPGDWIIRGVKGELYPCKPDIFVATYEQVE